MKRGSSQDCWTAKTDGLFMFAEKETNFKTRCWSICAKIKSWICLIHIWGMVINPWTGILHIQYKDSHSGMDDHTRHYHVYNLTMAQVQKSQHEGRVPPTVKINILINSTSHGVIAATTGYHRVSSDGWISVLLVKLIIMCDWSGPHCVFDFLPIFQGFNLVPSMIRGHAASSVCFNTVQPHRKDYLT